MRLLRRLGRNDTFLLRLLRDDILLLLRRRRRRLLRKHRRRVGNTSVGGSKTHGFFLPFLFSSALFVMLVQIEESRAFRCGAAAWLLFLSFFVSLVPRRGFDPPPKTTQSQPLALKMLEERDKENNQAKKEQKFIFIRKGEWVPMFHHFTSSLLSACTSLFLLPLDGRRSRNEKTRLLRRFNARRDRGCAQTHSLQRVRIGKKMYNPTRI